MRVREERSKRKCMTGGRGRDKTEGMESESKEGTKA